METDILSSLILTSLFLTDSSGDMQRLEKPILLLYDAHKIKIVNVIH